MDGVVPLFQNERGHTALERVHGLMKGRRVAARECVLGGPKMLRRIFQENFDELREKQTITSGPAQGLSLVECG